MDRFQNKYRIPSTRLQHWDYGWIAAYFVTICTKDQVCYFGEVIAGRMILSEAGITADILWHEILNHTKNIELGSFVVMPNHVHGILVLNDPPVETTHALSLRPASLGDETIGQSRFQHQGRNTLSSIIGSYKSAVSKHLHRLGLEFAWQSRFYDRILRNEKEYRAISDYIINNPLRWEDDKFK